MVCLLWVQILIHVLPHLVQGNAHKPQRSWEIVVPSLGIDLTMFGQKLRRQLSSAFDRSFHATKNMPKKPQFQRRGWDNTGQLTSRLKWTGVDFNTCVLIFNTPWFISIVTNLSCWFFSAVAQGNGYAMPNAGIDLMTFRLDKIASCQLSILMSRPFHTTETVLKRPIPLPGPRRTTGQLPHE